MDINSTPPHINEQLDSLDKLLSPNSTIKGNGAGATRSFKAEVLKPMFFALARLHTMDEAFDKINQSLRKLDLAQFDKKPDFQAKLESILPKLETMKKSIDSYVKGKQEHNPLLKKKLTIAAETLAKTMGDKLKTLKEWDDFKKTDLDLKIRKAVELISSGKYIKENLKTAFFNSVQKTIMDSIPKMNAKQVDELIKDPEKGHLRIEKKRTVRQEIDNLSQSSNIWLGSKSDRKMMMKHIDEHIDGLSKSELKNLKGDDLLYLTHQMIVRAYVLTRFEKAGIIDKTTIEKEHSTTLSVISSFYSMKVDFLMKSKAAIVDLSGDINRNAIFLKLVEMVEDESDLDTMRVNMRAMVDKRNDSNDVKDFLSWCSEQYKALNKALPQ